MNMDTERRKHERVKLTNNAFAYLRSSFSDSIVAAKLIDISHQGLGLEHMGEEISPHTSVELDIVLPAGEASLQELTGVTIYDHEINSIEEVRHHTRHCGIGFRDLTLSQKSYVHSLLQYFKKKSES